MQVFERLWLFLLIVSVFPLVYYRSQFRKAIYNSNRWVVLLGPFTHKEFKTFFGNMFPENAKYHHFRNLYRLYSGIFILLFSSFFIFNFSGNMHKLKIGSTIPGFILPDQNGNLFDVTTILGKKNLVIYFYPKDDTPGCTKEACSFRDQFEVFKKENALIIGISGQSVKSHEEFATKYKLNYTLLSDEGNEVRKLFGVPNSFLGLFPGRVTYIINKKGKVVYIFNSQTEITKHVDEALRILKLLN